MDMFDGVGRRRDQSEGKLFDLGSNSLNGNERDCLFRNNGDGTFSDVAYVNNADRVEDGRGVAIVDYDRDGHPDIMLRNYRQPTQVLHNVSTAGNWLELKLVGTRSNRDAVGAHVTLTAGGLKQMREVHAGSGYQSSSTLVQHFGLGGATVVDEIRIRWPFGGESYLTGVAANRLVTIREDSL